jgi:hypothetical protein
MPESAPLFQRPPGCLAFTIQPRCASHAEAAKARGNKLLVKGSTALNRGTLLLLGEGAAKSSKQKVEEIPPQ